MTLFMSSFLLATNGRCGSRQCMYIEPIQVNVKKLDEALTNWALKMNWGK